MSFTNIETITFDATGTLFDPFPSIGAIYAEVLQAHGIHLSEPELDMRFLSQFHKSRAVPLNRTDELIERKRWQQVVQGILEEEFDPAIFEDLWHTLGEGERWKPKPRLTKTLQSLKDEGFKLVVVSNWDRRLYRILSELKLRRYFDNIYISTELGMEKPSECVYRKVASALAVHPSTLLHIGNSPSNDYKPAIRAGWNALLLHNRIPYGMEPGTVLGSMDQLPEVLKSEKLSR